tara:strand:- start:5873 stop:6379 length:507 start_codon:yes stop_codon:yes gene_type:complete
MNKKNIFIKKRSKNKYYFSIIILLIFIIYIYLIQKNNSNIFEINKNNLSFYDIPEDKKGKSIPNIDKKILDYKSNNEIIINEDLNSYKFTIQLFSSNNYEELINKKLDFIKKYNIDINEVFLAVLSHNLGLDYLLLYKNFETDSIARVFCLSYLEFLDDCLIVNVQNL